jgi:hypothetical protein
MTNKAATNRPKAICDRVRLKATMPTNEQQVRINTMITVWAGGFFQEWIGLSFADSGAVVWTVT